MSWRFTSALALPGTLSGRFEGRVCPKPVACQLCPSRTDLAALPRFRSQPRRLSQGDFEAVRRIAETVGNEVRLRLRSVDPPARLPALIIGHIPVAHPATTLVVLFVANANANATIPGAPVPVPARRWRGGSVGSR